MDPVGFLHVDCGVSAGLAHWPLYCRGFWFSGLSENPLREVYVRPILISQIVDKLHKCPIALNKCRIWAYFSPFLR